MCTNPIKRLFLVAGCVLLFPAGTIFAADMPESSPATPHEAWTGAARPPMDWVGHTQRMLDDLKTKLNLLNAQKKAWDVWSGSVLDNARAQSEKIKLWREEHMKQGFMGDSAHAHMTTPERMAHGLEHMRTEVKRMQDHVALLEAAEVSTRSFYNTLEPDQKTIFDLYWQQFYQGGWGEHGMMGHEGSGGHMGHDGPGMNY